MAPSDSEPKSLRRGLHEVEGRSQYRVERYVAEDAFGTLYEATQSALGRRVLLRLWPLGDRGAPRLKPLDAARLASLKHPSHVEVLDVGVFETESGPRSFVVTESLPHTSLREHLRAHGPMTLPRALAVTGQVLDALAEAHAVGIAHGAVSIDTVAVDASPNGPKAKLLGLVEQVVGDAGARRSSGDSVAVDLRAVTLLFYACIASAVGDVGASHAAFAVSLGTIPPALAEIVMRAAAPLDEGGFGGATGLRTALMQAAVPMLVGGSERVSNDVLPARSQTLPPPSDPGPPRSGTGRMREVWVLLGDPALDRASVRTAIDGLADGFQIVHVRAEERRAKAQALADGDAFPPSCVLMGDLHVLFDDVLLVALSERRSVAKVLLSIGVLPEILRLAVNRGGLDQHLTVPISAAELRAAVRACVARVAPVEMRAGSEVAFSRGQARRF